MESAGVNTYPWSGNWWPKLDSASPNLFDAGGALAKYDQYVQATRGYNPGARQWEYTNERTTDANNSWWGHCDVQAAASILAPDPQGPVTRAGVNFTQDDLEGLITSVYSDYDYYNPIGGGTRATSNDVNSAAYKDIDPAWMHYLLQYYVGQYHYPFVMDISTGSQVWNYPIAGYQSSTTKNADGSSNVSTRVWFTDAAAGARDSQYFVKDYTYRLQVTGEGRMTGTWTGASANDHPDFAWVPTASSGGDRTHTNPRIDESIVEEILGFAI